MVQKPFRGMRINKTHSLAKGLVGCWVFNERTGETVFDLSGYGNNGTIVGADWVADGLYFNGTSDYTKISRAECFEPNNISVVTSVKSPSVSTYDNIIAKYQASIGASYSLYTGSSKQIYFYVDTGAITLSPSGGDIWDNKYHNIVGSYDGNSVRIYIDGLEIGSGTTTSGNIDYNTGNLYFGAGNETSGFINVDIKYIYIYNRALTPNEISELNINPYQMFKKAINPALLYYETPSGTVYPMWYYNMLRRR